MESIGDVLKQERQTRGLSLEEVHEATRMTVQNLVALEEGRFDSFPNKVYARAFLRDYANFLGLDSGALVERLEEELGHSAEPVVLRHPPSTLHVVAYVLIVTVVAVGLAAVGYLGWSAKEDRQSASRVGATVHTPVKVEKPPMPVPKPAVEPVLPETKKLVMEVTTIGEVWVDVRTDGKSKICTIVAKGTTLKFEADNSIYIRVGRATAVKVSVNGEPQVMGAKSLPVTKVFTTPPPIR